MTPRSYHATRSERCGLCGSAISTQEIDDKQFVRLGDALTHRECAIARARAHADLVAVVAQTHQVRPVGRRHRAHCPFHDDRTPSFYVEERDGVQRFQCYGSSCGAHGDVVDYVRRRDGLGVAEAVRYLLGESAFVSHAPRERRPPPPPAQPLPLSAAERYHRALDDDARAWWERQGCTSEVIDTFQLGYCARCPTYYDPDQPDYRSSSYTIPIYAPDGTLLNIRHRVAQPLDPGDKYRPETRERGAHLFNLGSLGDSKDVVICEGEKKVMVWWRFLPFFPAISATAGVSSWLRQYRDVWPPLLAHVARVFVVFDPGAEDEAERTAALFGRRGIPVFLPAKLDDYLLAYGKDPVIEAISDARPWRDASLYTIPARAWA
jgi:hypothetical protein